MTADIQGDQELEDQGVFGVGVSEIAEKTGGSTSNGSDQTENKVIVSCLIRVVLLLLLLLLLLFWTVPGVCLLVWVRGEVHA